MKAPVWLDETGRGPILASRVRIARNLPGVPFRGTITSQEARRVCVKVLEAVKGGHPAFAPFADETSEEARELSELGRIPANLVGTGDSGPWLSLEDNGRGLLVLDGDHVRFWSIRRGSALVDALEEAGVLEQAVGDRLVFRRDPDLGWLTASPVDVGSGLRASLLLHLPAMWVAARMTGVPEAMEAMGHPLRGPWGPLSEEDAGLVVLTHARSFGISETEIVRTLEASAAVLVREEEAALKAVLEHWGVELQDAVARSVAALSSARLLSRKELSARVRWIALGARCGWVPQVTAAAAMEAFLRTGEAALKRLAGPAAGEFEGSLDEWRAREASRLLRAGSGEF